MAPVVEGGRLNDVRRSSLKSAPEPHRLRHGVCDKSRHFCTSDQLQLKAIVFSGFAMAKVMA
jgi:hypothetical protein